MAIAEPKFFLRPNEEVRAEDRIQTRWTLRALLITVVVLGVLTVGVYFLADLLDPVPVWYWPGWYALAAFFFVLSLVLAWRRVVTTEYVITDETAYARTGRIVLYLESAPMDKITDISVSTSLLGRVMGYSTLVIRTAGGSIAFVGLADAYWLRGVVQDQRKGFVRRLLEEAGRPGDARRVERESGPPDVVRCRCPACDHALDAPAILPADVTCPNCGTEGTLFENEVAA